MTPCGDNHDDGWEDEEAAIRQASVASGQEGARLDRFLAETLPDLSRTRLKSLIEKGLASSDGVTIFDPSYRVKPSQTFAIIIPECEDAAPAPQHIDLSVVYEDEEVIVVDKPAGMVVHPAPGNPEGTLVNALLAHCGRSLSGIGGVRRPGIVHRLDKDTSGLLVAAKTDRAHASLAAQFAAHTVSRAYKAVVWGTPRPAAGTIEGNIGRSAADRKKMAVVVRGGKEARTRYRVEKVFFGGELSLVDCRLETGRTHQVRVHLAAKGHPLVGDRTYGRASAARLRRLSPTAREAVAGFARQALHAYRLGFSHPRSGDRLEFVGEMPNDLKGLVHTLEAV